MTLYQLYSNPAELKWVNEANEKIPEVFASDDDGEFDHNKSYSYTPEQIKSIAKDPKYAYYYAKDVLKQRWPEAEPTIMKDPIYAYRYAADVLTQRWLEAEPYIKTNDYYWELYKIYFRILE